MLRQYELVDIVKSYDPNANEDALNKAAGALIKSAILKLSEPIKKFILQFAFIFTT